MEALKIITASWPLAFMFFSLCIGIVLFYLIRSRDKRRAEELMSRVNHARDVTVRDNAG